MPPPYRLALGETERTTLEPVRDHGPKAYLRERAATLLALAAGASIRQATQAAQDAGFNPHAADTVGAWVARSQTQGGVGR